VHLQFHDTAYWLAKAADALKRAERCQGDTAAHALLLGLAEDYAWLAGRARPHSPARSPKAANTAQNLEIAR
jgi:hypothetical protein